MLKQLSAAPIVLLVLAPLEPAGAQSGPSCVQSGVAAGGGHTCAFTEGGSEMCWGDNGLGQLGNGTSGAPTLRPTAVAEVVAHTHTIVAGRGHSCAISGQSFSAVCWGDNTFGQLGNGLSGAGVFSAIQVLVVTSGGLPWFQASALAAGDRHSCELDAGGRVQCWGDNEFGQLGDGGTEALRANPNSLILNILDGLAGVISAGTNHTCAVMRDNTARCWGDNTFGQIGNGMSGPPVRTPATVIINTPPSYVTSIAAGEGHTCALFTDGTVSCWGTAYKGELGSNTSFTTTPVQVPGLSGVQEIAAGSFHTCALMMTTDTVQCWGDNAYGQLGPAGGMNSASPVTVTDANGNPLSGVAHISARARHTCAALLAGGVQCWGDNFTDQLGASTAPNTMSATPVAVGGLCTCPGLTSCNGLCTDTSSDPANCGGCGRRCPSGICTNSACVDGAICRGHCEDGYAACLDSCVADFESCPVDTPRLNCIQAYKACTKSCRDQRGQCLARCG